jgi:TP901-1 family phage major tail protein
MTGIRGRAIQVKRGGTLVAGVRTKSITINGSPIDITSDDDAGVRKLLDQPGQIDVSISVSGVVVSEQLRTESLSASDRVQATLFQYQDGYEGSPNNTHGFSGDFFLASYTETGEYQGAVTFEAEFQSAGAVTYSAE